MEHTQLTPELIVDLLFEPKPTLTICGDHNLSIHQLAQILDSHEYRQLEADMARIQHRRAPALRRRLLTTLEDIATQTPSSPTHAETIRKAAAQLLRLTEPPKQDAQAQEETDTKPEDHRPGRDEQEKYAHTPGRDAAAQDDPPQIDSLRPHEHTHEEPQPHPEPNHRIPSTKRNTHRNGKSRKRKR